MSFVDILIHVVTTNTCTTTLILQHQQVQITRGSFHVKLNATCGQSFLPSYYMT